MPGGLQRHCVVKLDESSILIIGGKELSDEFTSDGFYSWDYDSNMELGRFSIRSSLKQGRYDHMCAVIVDSLVHDQKMIIVAGGDRHDSASLSVELMHALSEGLYNTQWFKGPEIGIDLHSAAGVASQDQKSFYVVGGIINDWQTSKKIFEMKCRNLLCQWEQWERELDRTMYQITAFVMPGQGYGCQVQED